MPTNPADIVNLIRDAQKDLTYAKAKLATIEEYFASMGTVETRPHKCPIETCGLTFRTETELRDHAINVHDDHQWIPEPDIPADPEERRQIAEQLRAQFASTTEELPY